MDLSLVVPVALWAAASVVAVVAITLAMAVAMTATGAAAYAAAKLARKGLELWKNAWITLTK